MTHNVLKLKHKVRGYHTEISFLRIACEKIQTLNINKKRSILFPAITSKLNISLFAPFVVKILAAMFSIQYLLTKQKNITKFDIIQQKMLFVASYNDMSIVFMTIKFFHLY